jgi:hypothetical protein
VLYSGGKAEDAQMVSGNVEMSKLAEMIAKARANVK